jgi:pimeloyl-ACP methyl ester carboxylesterase
MNRFRITPLLITALIVVVAGSTFALKPLREYPAVPSEYDLIYRDVTFLTRDSLHIKGWFFPAQDTAGISNELIGYVPVEPSLKRTGRVYATQDSLRRPTVVVCSADGGNMVQFIPYAYNLCTRGFNVLLFDWRGFGGSDDWPMEQDNLCYTEFLNDCDAAVEFVRQQPEVDPKRIGLFGCSTGAYLSFAIAAKRNDIAAYAGRALMTSFDEVLPIVRALKPDRDLRAPADYPKELQPINAAKTMKIPVFLIVGEKDDRTPVWMSEKIIAALQGPKELWIAPGAAHGGPDGPEGMYYEEFFARLAEFFHKNM